MCVRGWVARSSWPILLSTHHREKSTPGFTNIRIHCLTLSNPFGAHYYVKISSLREGRGRSTPSTRQLDACHKRRVRRL